MKAFLFPGQGAQFVNMGKNLYEQNDAARSLFDKADQLFGESLSAIMFEGSEEDLRQTKVTQPAIFLHSLATVAAAGQAFKPDMVAGHSLGEFSALVAVGAMSFTDGFRLVRERALAMQEACEMKPGTMAAVIGMDDDAIEEICNSITDHIVSPANFNCPGQLVISGTEEGVAAATTLLQEAGARRVIPLKVAGAFHSELMAPAADRLREAVASTGIEAPSCPVYQNVSAQPVTDPEQIKSNLLEQLTAPVRWTQTIKNMLSDGADHFYEVGGSGRVLCGLVKKVDRKLPAETLEVL